MTLESPSLVDRLKDDPDFKALVSQRSFLAWTLSIVMLVIYFGFICVIAFKEKLGNIFGIPLFPGSATSVGIPVGVGVIVSAFVLTGIYVWRANSAFDELTSRIVEKAKK
jgi:uncharacterized membrane protein (DUF485 family)